MFDEAGWDVLTLFVNPLMAGRRLIRTLKREKRSEERNGEISMISLPGAGIIKSIRNEDDAKTGRQDSLQELYNKANNRMDLVSLLKCDAAGERLH